MLRLIQNQLFEIICAINICLLLESRAVIYPVTKYSPLYIAAYNGKKDIVEVRSIPS